MEVKDAIFKKQILKMYLQDLMEIPATSEDHGTYAISC